MKDRTNQTPSNSTLLNFNLLAINEITEESNDDLYGNNPNLSKCREM